MQIFVIYMYMCVCIHIYVYIPTHIYTYRLLAPNKAYKSCLGALEGTFSLHPWHSVLMHLQIITLPSFTLPTCSNTIPDSTRTSFQGKGEKMHAHVSCITFRNGVICEEFFSCCRTECPTSWWLELRYKHVSTLKSRINFKNVSLARSSDEEHTLGTHT